MHNYLKITVSLLLLFSVVMVTATYINLDNLAKNCFLLADRIVNGKNVKQKTLDWDPGTGAVGSPATKTEAKYINTGRDRRKITVSRDGKTTEYWILGAIFQAYDEIGGIKSILGVPTSNEYRWKGGLRQDFERGQWIFWSRSTGVKINYTPPGYSTDETPPLQPPVFLAGKPSVEWSRFSKERYFITQDFGENGHLGQDLGLYGNPDPGYDVHPITNGKVIFSGWTGSNSYGYSVLIQHTLGNGRYFYSQYSHLYDNPGVNPGQYVTRETVLGKIGNTGKSTGPHLDLQIKEIPQIDNKKLQDITLSDLGYGYSPGHISFTGNIYYDLRTGQTYYKPSYFIETYKNDPAALINELHRIMDLSLNLRSLPPLSK